MYIYMYVKKNVYTKRYKHTCTPMFMSTSKRIYPKLYMHIQVYVCIHIYIYVYVDIHTSYMFHFISVHEYCFDSTASCNGAVSLDCACGSLRNGRHQRLRTMHAWGAKWCEGSRTEEERQVMITWLGRTLDFWDKRLECFGRNVGNF